MAFNLWPFRLRPFNLRPFILRPFVLIPFTLVAFALVAFVLFPFVLRQFHLWPFEQRTVSPARNTTAVWRGTGEWLQGPQSKQTQVDCNYKGNVTLTLNQNGNNLNGNLQVVRTSGTHGPNPYANVPNIVWSPPSCTAGTGGLNGAVTGTASSSSFRLSMGQALTITGSFTTDLLRGNFEWCTAPNARSQIQGCSSGGFYKGSFTLSK